MIYRLASRAGRRRDGAEPKKAVRVVTSAAWSLAAAAVAAAAVAAAAVAFCY